MVSKVILTAKGFATGVAGIGSFIGMGSEQCFLRENSHMNNNLTAERGHGQNEHSDLPLVDQQIIGLGKMSITVLADELLFRSVRFTTGATSARKQKPENCAIGGTEELVLDANFDRRPTKVGDCKATW